MESCCLEEITVDHSGCAGLIAWLTELEAKSQRRVNNANKLKLALDEEEITDDIKGWVVSVITWMHTLMARDVQWQI